MNWKQERQTIWSDAYAYAFKKGEPIIAAMAFADEALRDKEQWELEQATEMYRGLQEDLANGGI